MNEPLEVPADWASLVKAFSDDTAGVGWYLHLPTGRVVRVEESDPTIPSFRADDGYLVIERARSKEQYRWMERYIMRLDDRELASQLSHAIAGKRAFQRFKAVLGEHPGYLADWIAFRKRQLARCVRTWLDAHGLVVPRTWREQDRASGGQANEALASFEAALDDLADEDLRTLLAAAGFLFERGRMRDVEEDE